MCIITNTLSVIQEKRILVIGDVMIDRYITGSISRISPEAPVPVLLHSSTENRLGGAANVAKNINGLQGKAILTAVIGEDSNGEVLQNLLADDGIEDTLLQVDPTRPTTCKTRVMSGWHHFLRVDQESTDDLSDEVVSALCGHIAHLIEEARIDAIILQDYNKGVLTLSLISEVLERAKEKGIKVFVDPKNKHFWDYKSAWLFKPNLLEARTNLPMAVDLTSSSLLDASKHIMTRLGCSNVIITLGSAGMFGYDGSNYHWLRPPTIEVADVCGAGDAVISSLSMCMAAGLSLEESMTFANLVAARVCQVPGVQPISMDLLNGDA